MRVRQMSLVLGSAIIMIQSGSALLAAAPPISPTQFEHLRAVIPPAPLEQKWQQIPWMTDLWAARQKAAGEGKPILLWEMDGHPLGCV